MAKTKNPKLAAILNFFIWGLGYLYLGRRINFGIILIIGEIAGAAAIFTETIDTITSIMLFIFSIAFAVDAYQETKNR